MTRCDSRHPRLSIAIRSTCTYARRGRNGSVRSRCEAEKGTPTRLKKPLRGGAPSPATSAQVLPRSRCGGLHLFFVFLLCFYVYIIVKSAWFPFPASLWMGCFELKPQQRRGPCPPPLPPRHFTSWRGTLFFHNVPPPPSHSKLRPVGDPRHHLSAGKDKKIWSESHNPSSRRPAFQSVILRPMFPQQEKSPLQNGCPEDIVCFL